ncbi:MAG: hypothetical protein ACJ8FY_20490 [Gemmataceae bacterium]
MLSRAAFITLAFLVCKTQASIAQEFEALGESAILEQQLRMVKKTQALLVSRISYRAINDPKTTLKSALENLAEEPDLTFEIDLQTFEKEGFKDIEESLIAPRDPFP